MATSPEAPDPAPAAPRPRTRNPWWIPPFLGRVPDVEPAHLRILGLVCFCMMFEQYDLSLINAAIVHIAEDLGMSIERSGFYLSVVRLGGLATIVLVPLADRIGRRRIFLGALILMSAGTASTALAQTPWQFTLIQAVARGCMLSGAAVSVVILVEEFPAAHRGWGVGMLSVLSGLGYGLGVGLFAAIDYLPYGWRALYAVGVLPLLLLPFYRRSLKETARFTAHRLQAGPPAAFGLRDWLGPLVDFARTHPRRAVGVGLAGMLGAVGGIGLFQYSSYVVQTVHGWEAWQYTVMVIGGGLLGMGGGIVGGRLSDRIGRRFVGAIFLLLAPVAGSGFFVAPGWSLAPVFGAFVFCVAAGDVVVRSLSAELFPTSHRGTSVGAFYVVQSLGFSAGLVLLALGSQWTGDLQVALRILPLAIALAGLCVLLLPETHRRELEDISGEG